MQSWIRDLIDLKTQISVLQNCMHAASQQPCTASQPLQGCRQCEPWTGATAAIYPATAWPAQSPHAGVAQPARRTHQLVGSGIGRPVIYSSRKCPAADSRAATATPRIEVQVTEILQQEEHLFSEAVPRGRICRFVTLVY